MKKWGTGTRGFTILETMIVMAVSAAMLLTVVVALGGRQRDVEYSQSIRDIESKIQDVINDTATGYFPQDNSTSCTAGIGPGGGPGVSQIGTNEQGSSNQCVFLGRTMHFHDEDIRIYPVIGNKGESDAASASATFASAHPVAVDFMEEIYTYKYGLRLKSVHWDASSTDQKNSGALITFASSPNGTGQALGGGLNPGIQKVSTYSSGIPSSAAVGFGTAFSGLHSVLQTPTLSWPSGGYVILCFEDSASGAGRNFGGIVISGGTRELSASVQLAGMGYQCT